MFDSHTHAHFAAFEADYKEVINRAIKAGVGLINVGTQLDTSRRAIEVAHEFENEPVYATVGLHPTHTEKSYHDSQELGGGDAAKAFVSRGEEFDSKVYLEMAKDPKVVAIGECGLDYYRLTTPTPTGSELRPGTASVGADNLQLTTETKKRQKNVFLQHVEIAKAVKKPLMIHCRPSKGTDDAYEDLLQILRTTNCALPPISHFYVGSPAITAKMIEAGFYFTFGGVITFPRPTAQGGGLGAGYYDEQIKMIPDNRILLETDAPYVAPQSKRGQRNEPAYIIEIAQKMAEIRGVEYTRIEEIVKENAERIFKIHLSL